MSKLHLDSFIVKQFRLFRSLEIPRLGQVNLITGKNAVGKTALLETLRLYADSGSARILRQLLDERGELYRVDNQQEPSPESITEANIYDSVRNIFYGRPDIQDAMNPVEMGSVQHVQSRLTIAPVFLVEEIGEDRIPRYRPSNPQWPFEQMRLGNREIALMEQIPGLAIRAGTAPELILPLNRFVDRRRPLEAKAAPPRFPLVFVSTQGLLTPKLRSLWEAITLTDLEANVKETLNIVSPEKIEGINIVGGAAYRGDGAVLVRTELNARPVPLRTLGEGMMRAFGLALALVNARDGLLLVDEIDSGLHYSVQYEIWKMIFQMAQRLDIQVFATTHNWDSITAFQQAAAEQTDLEGMLIRLHRYADDIVPTLFDERRLAIATRDQIEVR